jgi:hypothetical protein
MRNAPCGQVDVFFRQEHRCHYRGAHQSARHSAAGNSIIQSFVSAHAAILAATWREAVGKLQPDGVDGRPALDDRPGWGGRRRRVVARAFGKT